MRISDNFLLFNFFIRRKFSQKPPRRSLGSLCLEHANCVTWISATVRLEVSVGGRSMQNQKLEALGTIIAEDGLTVVSLTKVDPTANILSAYAPSASVQVNYTEVLILMHDGSEKNRPRGLNFKRENRGSRLSVAISKSSNRPKSKIFNGSSVEEKNNPMPEVLDQVISISKLGRNLYRQSTLRRGWVNAVIEKPSQYFVIENTEPGTPVFDDREMAWRGGLQNGCGKTHRSGPLPFQDVLEIADQVRSRTQ